jgi:hypothetical protein
MNGTVDCLPRMMNGTVVPEFDFVGKQSHALDSD